MAKSFKKLISEVAEPKSAGERAFVDQHVVQRFDAQPSGQDHIFNGSTAPKKRLADFMPGQDAAAYDAAYKTSDGDDSIVDMPEEAEDPDAAELTEDPGEEKPMMMGQLRAMAHNLQGIARYIATTADPEEWFQNKLAGVAKEMQTMYGYATAETMSMGEGLAEASCGCGPDCKHCGGDHADAEVGQECGCCGNMIKEEVNEGILGAIGGAALAHKAGAGIVGKVVGGAVGSAVQDRIAGKKKKEETVDGRRLSFKEKAAKLGYAKSENAFVAKAAKEKLNGKKKMVMGNKEYPVTMKKDNAEKIDAKLDEAAPKISKGKAKGSIAATGLRGKGMKKFDVNVAVENGKFEFRITDETGRFQTVGIKQAAKMLGESTVDDLVNEAKKPAPKKKLTVKQMRQALDSQDERGKTKKKVTLKKAPWESTELEEKFTIKTSILSLDSGEKVKVSRDDAKLLTKFFADLNPRNSKEMRKVLVKDKDGYNEILGFAREAL